MPRTFNKSLRILFGLPLMVLLLPFVGLGIGIIFIVGTVRGMWDRTRWLRNLRRQGRVKAASEILTMAGDGSLIIDRPGFNLSKGTHCWWTKENVSELSPTPIPSDEERIELCKQKAEMIASEFDTWCWSQYLSPDTGSAILVAPARHGEKVAAIICKHQPGLRCIKSWSAIPATASMRKQANGRCDGREQK